MLASRPPRATRGQQGEAQEQRGWTTLVSSPADINGEVGIAIMSNTRRSRAISATPHSNHLEHEMASCEGV